MIRIQFRDAYAVFSILTVFHEVHSLMEEEEWDTLLLVKKDW